MSTSINLTPVPADGAVQIVVAATGGDVPSTVYSKNGAAIYAERASWTLADGAAMSSVHPTEVHFFTTGGGPWQIGQARRRFTGLTAGATYRFTMLARRVPYYPGQPDISIDAGPVPGGGIQSFIFPNGEDGLYYNVLEVVAQTTYLDLTLHTIGVDSPGIESLTVDMIPAGYSFALTRSDRNGVAPVRLAEGQGLVGGALIVTDYEPALAGPIQYTVHTITNVTATTTLDVEDVWLTVPELPQFGQLVNMISGFDSGRSSGTTAHDVIDRRDPILTVARLRTRRGTLTLWCPSFEAAQALVSAYDQGVAVMLRQPYKVGMDLYHYLAPGAELGVAALDVDSDLWSVTVPYVECANPTGPQQGALNWTYGDGLARNATYQLDALEFPTYADRVAGP